MRRNMGTVHLQGEISSVEMITYLFFFFLQQCFDKAEEVIDDSQLKEKKMSRDEWTHGSLLIINELLRCSNVEGEVSPECSLSLFLSLSVSLSLFLSYSPFIPLSPSLFTP